MNAEWSIGEDMLFLSVIKELCHGCDKDVAVFSLIVTYRFVLTSVNFSMARYSYSKIMC